MNPEAELLELVERAQNGEPEATLELLARFEPLLGKWRRRLSRQLPREDAEVLRGEVTFHFLLLVLEFNHQRGAPFAGFMECMLESRLQSFVRREQTPRHVWISDYLAFWGETVTNDEVLEQLMHIHDDRSYVTFMIWWLEARLCLTKRQRHVIEGVLRGDTERELASQLGVSQVAVNKIKSQAQKKLKVFFQNGYQNGFEKHLL